MPTDYFMEAAARWFFIVCGGAVMLAAVALTLAVVAAVAN